MADINTGGFVYILFDASLWRGGERRGEGHFCYVCEVPAIPIGDGFSRGLEFRFRWWSQSCHIIPYIHTYIPTTTVHPNPRLNSSRNPRLTKTPRKKSQINLPPQKPGLHWCFPEGYPKLPIWPNPRCISPANASAVPMQNRRI